MYSPFDKDIAVVNSNVSLIKDQDETEVLAFIVVKNLLFVFGMFLVCPTLYFFVKYRHTLYTDPIYIIWRSYFVTRILLLLMTPLSTGHYAPLSFRNSPFCLLYTYRLLVVLITVAARQSLMLVVYQGIVMFMPLRFFRWRNSTGFRRVWRIALILDWLYSVGYMIFFLIVSKGGFNYYTACYVHQKAFEIPGNSVKTAALSMMYLNLFVPQIFTALLYICFFLGSLFKRKTGELTEEQRKIVRIQGQIGVVGFISFSVTLCEQIIQVLNKYEAITPALIANHPAIHVSLIFVDRSFDPIWHYWRNSVFRAQINEKLGITDAKVSAQSRPTNK